MASAVTGKCLGEVYGQCYPVCPVDAIYSGTYKGEGFTVIDPEVCISCGACVAACPIGAIAENEDATPDWAAVNKELAGSFKGNPRPPAARPATDPPRKPDNRLK